LFCGRKSEKEAFKKCLKIPQGYSEAINIKKQDNAKRKKGQTMKHKTLQRKLKIEQLTW
jgi:hypothetical protein